MSGDSKDIFLASIFGERTRDKISISQTIITMEIKSLSVILEISNKMA
jgi:hypothetical protein